MRPAPMQPGMTDKMYAFRPHMTILQEQDQNTRANPRLA